jgi:HAD superfamily hydrolase (TIGR01509 family)
MPQLQALIFDVDGTLAETERDGHRVAFNRAFAAVGLDWNWSIATYGELLEIAGGKERIQHYLQNNLQTDRPEFKPAAEITAWSAALHRTKTQHYQQLLKEGMIPLRPGVKRLLQEARAAGVRLAIATTSAPDNVMVLLETALGPDSPTWFEVIAAGDMVPAKKPAPDVYHYVLQAMDLSPSECLAIEDSYQGLQAARQAGIPTVITINPYTAQHDFTGALLVLNHLGEPDDPFARLAGDALPATYFDLALARSLLAAEDGNQTHNELVQ